MAAKQPILISRYFNFGQNLKNHFPKGIFQWRHSRRTWIDLHYWNNIKKKIFHFKMVAKTIFWYCTIMLVYTLQEFRARNFELVDSALRNPCVSGKRLALCALKLALLARSWILSRRIESLTKTTMYMAQNVSFYLGVLTISSIMYEYKTHQKYFWMQEQQKLLRCLLHRLVYPL